MKIPHSLKVGGHKVDIKLVNRVTNDADGQWDSSENTIYLNKCLPKSQLEVTLLHELLHCMNIIMDHREVEFLAQGLYQIFKDNKMRFDK